jgi:hypothetical protein
MIPSIEKEYRSLISKLYKAEKREKKGKKVEGERPPRRSCDL